MNICKLNNPAIFSIALALFKKISDFLFLKYLWLTYTILIILVLMERINSFFRFSIQYADSDQTVMWHIARDLMNGEFHGPCFYGQNYNPIVEPVFSLPFLLLGMDYIMALPLVTSLMGIIPYYLLSFYFYKKINPLTGLIPFMVVLLLPTEYTMLTSIPRGFVSGIFFSVTAYLIFSFYRSDISKFISGILLGFSLYLNPNVVLLFPLILFQIPNGFKIILRTFYLPAIGFFVGLIPLWMNYLFYKNNPGLVIHGGINLNLSLEVFQYVFAHLDNFFNYISPGMWIGGWTTLLFFMAVGFRLWKFKLKKNAVTVFLVLLLILLSFSLQKVREGTMSVFFSGSRMYLAYPIIIIFLLNEFLKTFSEEMRKTIFNALLFICCLSVIIKLSFFSFFLSNSLDVKKNTIVHVFKIKDLKKTCNDLLQFGNRRPDLVIANSGSTLDQPINYGCPCLVEGFPPTMSSEYERRTWIFEESLGREYKNILIHGSNTKFWSKKNIEQLNIIRQDEEKSWILIENEQNTRELLLKTGLLNQNKLIE